MQKVFEWFIAVFCLSLIVLTIFIFALIILPFAVLERLCEVLCEVFGTARLVFKIIVKCNLKILGFFIDLFGRAYFRIFYPNSVKN
jgi:hypothetical protein